MLPSNHILQILGARKTWLKLLNSSTVILHISFTFWKDITLRYRFPRIVYNQNKQHHTSDIILFGFGFRIYQDTAQNMLAYNEIMNRKMNKQYLIETTKCFRGAITQFRYQIYVLVITRLNLMRINYIIYRLEYYHKWKLFTY